MSGSELFAVLAAFAGGIIFALYGLPVLRAMIAEWRFRRRAR